MLSDYNNIIQRSMEMYPRYLSQHPDDARAHIFYAQNLAKLGKVDEARKSGKKAYELSPNEAVMLYNLACLFSRLEEREEAEEERGSSYPDTTDPGYQDRDQGQCHPAFQYRHDRPRCCGNR